MFILFFQFFGPVGTIKSSLAPAFVKGATDSFNTQQFLNNKSLKSIKYSMLCVAWFWGRLSFSSYFVSKQAHSQLIFRPQTGLNGIGQAKLVRNERAEKVPNYGRGGWGGEAYTQCRPSFNLGDPHPDGRFSSRGAK